MKNKSLLFFFFALLIGAGSLVLASGPGNGLFSDPEKSPNQAQVISDPLPDGERINSQSSGNLKSGNISLDWQTAGPDNVGGRTRTILFDKRDPNALTVYASSVNGCIWKSTNLGSTWNKVNQANANLNVSCMTQTDNNDIYAGTGEYGFTQGSGLYVSTDGDNFTRVPGTEPVTVNNSLEWGYINELAAHNGRIYAATNSGLKYRDSGSTEWLTAKYIDDEGQLQPLSGFVWDVKVGSNGIVAASVDSKVFVSPDGQPNGFINHSKKQVLSDTTLFPEKLPSTGLGRIELAIAPSNPDYIYASATDPYGFFDNVYKSSDKGNSWEIIFPGKSSTIPDIFAISSVSYGFVANTIVVYPNDPDKVLVGGVNMWQGYKTNEGFYYWGNSPVTNYLYGKFDEQYLHELHHTYVFSPKNPKIFLVGTDGGLSINIDGQLEFKTINRNYNVAQFISLDVTGNGKPIGGTLGNGIQYVMGGNTPYTSFEVWNQDYSNSGDGGYVAISKINPEVLILSRKGGPFRRSEDVGFSFSTTFLGTGMSVPVNTYCPMILWESFEDATSVDTTRFKALKSIAAGEEIIVRSRIYDFPFKTTAPKDLAQGEVIYLKDPLQAKTFLALGDKVYYTKEALDFTKQPEWWQIGKVTGTISALGISGDANHLYVGTETGNVYRISNLTRANSAATADISSIICVVSVNQIKAFPNRNIASIAVDPKNPMHFVLTLGGYGNNEYVYNVTNGLDSLPVFNNVQGNLPKAPVYSSVIEMNNSDMVILGTENGIYMTENVSAANWTKDSGPMGSIPVRALKQQTVNFGGITVPSDDPAIPTQYYPGFTNTGVIYAATYGRGIWSSQAFLSLEEPITPPYADVLSLKVSPNPVREFLNIQLNLPFGSAIHAEIFDISGKLVASETQLAQAGAYTFRMDASRLKPGTYFVKVTTATSQATGKFIVTK